MIGFRSSSFVLVASVLLAFSLLGEHAESSLVPVVAKADGSFVVKSWLSPSFKQRRRRRRPSLGGGDDDDDEEFEEEEEEFVDEDGDGENDNDESFFDCFPASASVSLENGSSILMKDISVGDRVRVSVAGDVSDVFMFTHALPVGRFQFVRLETEDGFSVSLSPGHYIYASGELIEASHVKIGDVLQVEKDGGKLSKIVSVSRVVSDGLYNPQTLHGDIVVDGVLASTYTKAVSPEIAHGLLLAPMRLVFRALGIDVSAKSLEKGVAPWIQKAIVSASKYAGRAF